MKWETEKITVPSCRVIMRYNDITISITKGNGNWQFFDICFGEFSESSIEKCQESWPMQAISIARTKLDELEKSLTEEKNETNL